MSTRAKHHTVCSFVFFTAFVPCSIRAKKLVFVFRSHCATTTTNFFLFFCYCLDIVSEAKNKKIRLVVKFLKRIPIPAHKTQIDLIYIFTVETASLEAVIIYSKGSENSWEILSTMSMKYVELEVI